MTNQLYEVDSGYVAPTLFNYIGDYDLNSQRIGEGLQTWIRENYQETYRGNFLQDNLHGDGKYLKIKQNESYSYEGTFYANNFEGYANITHMNGDYFEGLFKRNRRFGPGVYTYANGTQDVGLWYGTYLMRLSNVVFGEWIPKLARNPKAKLKLLKFRKLVPIKTEYEDVAKKILTDLNAPPEVIAMSDKLYNPFVKNTNSLFFNRKLHDTEFYGEIDCNIEVAKCESEVELLVSKSSISQSTTTPDIVKDILEYLLENIEIYETFPEKERKNFVYDSILKARERLILENSEKFVQELMMDYVSELDDILSRPMEERALIFNKRNIMRKLPRYSKSKLDLTVETITITDLLAWNNEELSIEMLLHVFYNRNKEDTVSFSVGRLLSGDRNRFNRPGDLEMKCITFLKYCSSGHASAAYQILQEDNLNPDLCDARGNSGIIFAASRDKWEIIKFLSQIGTNIDMHNDEGLTALNICILRYIALKDDIVDWERAFLPNAIITPEEQQQISEWHPHISITNVDFLSSTSLVSGFNIVDDNSSEIFNTIGTALKAMAEENVDASITDMYEEFRQMEVDLYFMDFQDQYVGKDDPTQSYIFSVKCVGAPHKKSEKLKTPWRKHDGVRTSQNISDDNASRTFVKRNKMQVVLYTIKVLLGAGADPNLSSVPLPALILAIFSEDVNLFTMLLRSKADLNITTPDENLCALHILAALPFSQVHADMFDLLLGNGANANLKTSAYHWVEEKEKIIGKNTLESEDFGKTPLHILSMRYDYEHFEEIQNDMVGNLLKYSGNTREIYLGHTPFTLAVLRGNLGLIKFYLNSGRVDPYVKVGEDMGVATTILILKRYINVLSLDRARRVYNLFYEQNVSPLVYIGGYGNAVEFMEIEYRSDAPPSDAGKRIVGKSRKADFSRSSRSSKKDKRSSAMEEIKKSLIRIGKNMLSRYIQNQAFQYLRRCIMQSLSSDEEIWNTLVKFLPPNDLINLLQLRISRELLESKQNHIYIIYKLLELSKNNNRLPKKSTKSDKRIYLTTKDIIKTFDWIPQQSTIHFNMIEPELDQQKEKYFVCFYCLKSIGKELIVCPKCGLVYFCCQECNRLSNKENTVHKCKLLFYDKEKKYKDQCLADGIEYKANSKLNETMTNLDKIFLRKHATHLKDLGISPDSENLIDRFPDLMNTQYFENLLETDADFLSKISEEVSDILGDLTKDVKDKKEAALRRKKGDIFSATSIGSKCGTKSIDSSSSTFSSRKGKISKSKKERKDKSQKDERSQRTKTERYPKKSRSLKSSKTTESSRRPESKTRHKKAKKSAKAPKEKRGKSKSSTRSERSSSRSTKSSRSRSKSSKERDKKLKTLYQRHGSRSKKKYSKEQSSKNAVYKQGISKSGRSRLHRHEAEQKRLRDLRDKSLKRGTEEKPEGTTEIYGKYRRLPNKCQYFIETFGDLFPDFDFVCLFWPYVCYVDGLLYYRFLEERPVFCQTYSNV